LLAHRIVRLFALRGEDGSELMEFAFVFPVLMGVITLVASASMGFYNYQQLANATSSAVQYVAEDQGLVTDPCATAVSQLESSWQVKNWNWGSSGASWSFQMAITDSSGTTTYYPSSTTMTTGTGFSCTAGAAEESANEPVVLKVSYSYNWFPIFSAIFNTHGVPVGGKMTPTTGALTVTQAAVPE
jgi:Flp pilus assembly protein TadG